MYVSVKKKGKIHGSKKNENVIFRPNTINYVEIELRACNLAEIEQLQGKRAHLILDNLVLNSASFYNDCNSPKLSARLQFIGN